MSAFDWSSKPESGFYKDKLKTHQVINFDHLCAWFFTVKEDCLLIQNSASSLLPVAMQL